ncbi:hypothetical protein TNCV_4266311 [Trichonephila clavipes]|nr:hypothetical protein TNCV_4266311 [Trichonephila clavipes]
MEGPYVVDYGNCRNSKNKEREKRYTVKEISLPNQNWQGLDLSVAPPTYFGNTRRPIEVEIYELMTHLFRRLKARNNMFSPHPQSNPQKGNLNKNLNYHFNCHRPGPLEPIIGK